MNRVRHLNLQQEHLLPSSERMFAPVGYCFLYVERGQAYWLEGSVSLVVNAGETLMVPPGRSGLLRASQIGEVTTRHFEFIPDWLVGFFTVPERRWLGSLSRRGSAGARVLGGIHPVSRQFFQLAARAETESGLERRCAMLDLATTALADQERPMALVPKRNGTVHERFVSLVSQMTDGELSHYGAKEFARLCGCSRRYLVTLFRHCFGVAIRVSRRDGRLVFGGEPAEPGQDGDPPKAVRDPALNRSMDSHGV